ncbi:uncharacterized protein [Triticum aestivum]|uniref:uncharacterized protein isoform X2 n=1 Tax=Triticum aestivum TaxID=4565 RepID=UPI001D01EE85|nr:uncharacterized protein LOC123166505 isoform X2 [Triticum aestivum]
MSCWGVLWPTQPSDSVLLSVAIAVEQLHFKTREEPRSKGEKRRSCLPPVAVTGGRKSRSCEGWRQSAGGAAAAASGGAPELGWQPGDWRCQAEAPMNKQNIFEGKRYEVLNLGGSIDKESDVGKKLLDIKAKGSQLLLEISECKQTLEQESNITASFPAAVQEMDKKSLEEEYKALQGDGAGEAEYFQSLEERIIKMKGVSDPIKCCCGLEYNVELGGESMGVR